MPMDDFFGQPLEIGDEVAFYAPGYRMFCLGKVMAFTPKQVRVAYTNTWNYGTPGSRMEYLAYPKMFIRRPPSREMPSDIEESGWKVGDVDRQSGAFSAEEIAAAAWR